MRVLVLNVGSSTVKAALYDGDSATWSAEREFHHGSPLAGLEGELRGLGAVDIAGHRVVHGGPSLRSTSWITAEVKAKIAAAADLAPEHNPKELAAIEDLERILGADLRHAAVFDTAFHSTLPQAAYVYPVPYEWLEQGIRRYGFHGISHQYVARRAAEILGRDPAGLRMVTCHLGNGCSLAAVRGGVCADTTMGFTPLEGLMMGSRSGSVDPGILLHLLRRPGMTVDKLDLALNKQSGLKGVSGLSNDMREILTARAGGHARAALAFDLFIHRLCCEIAAMTASLGGLDALVFTAGIGEHSPEVRTATCEGLVFLGVELDAGKNSASPRDADIATGDSSVRVVVVRTEENLEIARECRRLAGV